MKVLRLAAMVFGVLVIALIAIAFALPRQVHVERSVRIQASAGTVFALADDITRFNAWSPWAAIDPQTRYEFSGPARGAGATMHWSSEDPDVGDGEMQIVDSEPDRAVRMRLAFGPRAQASSNILIRSAEKGVIVTWGFDTDLGYSIVGRYMGLFMDRMLGPDFERGLAGLKRLAENAPARTGSAG